MPQLMEAKLMFKLLLNIISWKRLDSLELVYCPMCEAIHENNTNCQRND